MIRQWLVYACGALLIGPGQAVWAETGTSASDLGQEPAAPAAASVKDTTEIADDIEARVQGCFETAEIAVVKIESEHRLGVLSGTGFFISPTGTIMTSASLAMDTQSITVSRGMERYPAEVVMIDPRSGIALLEIEAGDDYLNPFGDVSVQVGTPLLAIGYPLDFPVSPAFGLVAGFDKHFNERFLSTTHIRAAIPCQPGQAGSPVLTLDGQLAGVLVTTIANGAGCHILPIRAARKVYEDYLRFGHVMHGWVGVTLEETSQPVRDSRARVVDLMQNTPAAESGIRNGDTVIQVGDVRIGRPLDIVDASFFLTAGDQVAIQVIREGEEHTFQVYPTYHPALALILPIGERPILRALGFTLSLQDGPEKALAPMP